MQAQRCKVELWRERDWRCEWWVVRGRTQVRLYLGPHLVSRLIEGPRLDLQRQTDEWQAAVHADRHRT
jgi:hypothetical protein